MTLLQREQAVSLEIFVGLAFPAKPDRIVERLVGEEIVSQMFDDLVEAGLRYSCNAQSGGGHLSGMGLAAFLLLFYSLGVPLRA